MKSIFRKVASLLVLALAFASCDKYKVESFDINSGAKLANFSYTSYPLYEDIWVIDDTEATTDDFAGLSAAIDRIGSDDDNEREISLVFPNLLSFPNFAIFGESESSYSLNTTALVSISAPEATSVGKSAFRFCQFIAALDLPKVSSIGNYAFQLGNSLTQVELPSLITLGDYAFEDCDSVTSFRFEKLETIGNYAMMDCELLEEFYLPSATTIGASALSKCESIESISLPSATTIGATQFNKNYALTTIDIPLLTQVSSSMFAYCTALTDVSLDDVTEVGSHAFYKCSALESISLPEATSVGYYAFADCTSLRYISIATNPGVKLDDIDSAILNGLDPTEITLTLGADNAEYVSGNILTIDGRSVEFKEIIVL
ncbi:MAG: leucine-rich repeat domain-containing protein [Rikenellaceae bacterium]